MTALLLRMLSLPAPVRGGDYDGQIIFSKEIEAVRSGRSPEGDAAPILGLDGHSCANAGVKHFDFCVEVGTRLDCNPGTSHHHLRAGRFYNLAPAVKLEGSQP